MMILSKIFNDRPTRAIALSAAVGLLGWIRGWGHGIFFVFFGTAVVLNEALKDPSERVRSEAMEALRQLGKI